MSYDGLVLNGVARECNELLTGARIDKIAQPGKNEIILHLRGQGKNYKLLVSALAQEARVHLTTAAPPNPDHPPVFCMVLRKHLEGGRIVSVEQQGLDRILHINISAMDEYGDIREKRLVAEIMGKHSNLILVDPGTGKIIDSMKRITEAVNRYRQVLPGEPYLTPPPTKKRPLWEEQEDTISASLMRAGTTQALDKVILSTYDGLGPLSVQELIHRAGCSPVDMLEYYGVHEYLRLFRIIQDLGSEIQAGSFTPEILLQDERPKEFSAIALTLYRREQRLAFGSMNDMLDAFFRERVSANLFIQRQRDLEQVIRREQERCRKKAGLQAESILEGKKAQKWQVYGALLTANHYQISQGGEALVTDYNDPEEKQIAIPMDPRFTPIENAQIYFKRYQKARQTAAKAQVFYDETMEELRYLDSLSLSLTTVRNIGELLEIREELEETGYLKPAEKNRRPSGGRRQKSSSVKDAKGKASSKQNTAAANPQIAKIRYNGYDILYGANNRQNDYLNMKIAKSGDLWFHAQNIPSAHVIVSNPDNSPVPDDVIEAAAKICLWHSQAKSAGRAAIDYTLRQNAWKPKGAKPGLMLYKQYQTIFVVTDEEDMRQLMR